MYTGTGVLARAVQSAGRLSGLRRLCPCTSRQRFCLSTSGRWVRLKLEDIYSKRPLSPEKPTTSLHFHLRSREISLLKPYFGPCPMAAESTSAIPQTRLTERALRRHTKATDNRPKTGNTETEVSFPTTVFTPPIDEELDPEPSDEVSGSRKRPHLAEYLRNDPEFLAFVETFKAPSLQTRDLHNSDYEPICLRREGSQIVFVRHPSPPAVEAAAEEHPQQSVDTDQYSPRLVATTPAQEAQLRAELPSHFPRFQFVQNLAELGFYVDRSQYTITVGPGPLEDLEYGIIVVPFGEEHMIFRCEHEPGEATKQQSCSRSDDVPPKITNPTSPATGRELPAQPTVAPKGRSPAKQTRKSREKSSPATKAVRTRRPQNATPLRRSQRLNAGQRTA